MNAENQLRWSDAWLLLAIHYAKDHALACLAAIMAAADYINHAIVNYEELASGMVRLERASLIKITPDFSSVTCSDKALAIIEPVVERIRTVHEARKEIERQINAAPWTTKEPVPHPANNLEYPGLTRDIYTGAVDEYLKSLKRKR
jgi:hypothetical protein